MNLGNKMFSEESKNWFYLLETQRIVDKKFSSLNQNNNFNGFRIDSKYSFQMKPHPKFDSESDQMEFILEMLINAFLYDFKIGTKYTLSLSSKQLPFNCDLPLLEKTRAKLENIDKKIINQMKEYVEVSLHDYSDVYTLSACIFVQN